MIYWLIDWLIDWFQERLQKRFEKAKLEEKSSSSRSQSNSGNYLPTYLPTSSTMMMMMINIFIIESNFSEKKFVEECQGVPGWNRSLLHQRRGGSHWRTQAKDLQVRHAIVYQVIVAASTNLFAWKPFALVLTEISNGVVLEPKIILYVIAILYFHWLDTCGCFEQRRVQNC